MNKQSYRDMITMQKLFEDEMRRQVADGNETKAADLLRAKERLTDIIETFYRMMDAI